MANIRIILNARSSNDADFARPRIVATDLSASPADIRPIGPVTILAGQTLTLVGAPEITLAQYVVLLVTGDVTVTLVRSAGTNSTIDIVGTTALPQPLFLPLAPTAIAGPWSDVNRITGITVECPSLGATAVVEGFVGGT